MSKGIWLPPSIKERLPRGSLIFGSSIILQTSILKFISKVLLFDLVSDGHAGEALLGYHGTLSTNTPLFAHRNRVRSVSNICAALKLFTLAVVMSSSGTEIFRLVSSCVRYRINPGVATRTPLKANALPPRRFTLYIFGQFSALAP